MKKPRTPEQTRALIREWVSQYEKLDHRGKTDAVGWISLKLSCSRREAEAAISDAFPREE